MISYSKQSIDQSDIDAVVDVFNSDWLTQGPAVETFENDLKSYFGAKHTCAVVNGTAALHLTGLALGWQTGDIVITSPITFLATANCIVYSGATPDFVDIDPDTYIIDPNLVEDKVKTYQSQGKKIKAVIGVDYAGHPCDWKGLREIADKYDLQLVNDNCHTMGASYFGDKQFAVKYADVVIQSYHPVKHITTGEGGAALTNNPEIDDKIRCLRTHGMTKEPNKLDDNDGPWYYEMHEVGYNYRITDFQCALGSSQLKKLDHYVQKRREIAKKYDELFSNIDNLKIPETHNSVDHVYHLYPLQIDFEKLSLAKPDFFQKMKQLGINLQVHYMPVHLQPFYKRNYSFKPGDYPIAEKFYYQVVSIPLYPSLTDEEVEKVVNDITKFVRSK
uniref:Udp-4-keto-6-deoxy-n-acetylglucosamine 4-aminotransferase n=1 Tax=uncultured marine thaumarchaeote KM3_87_H02 TaxID=1456331 RepID=A0A075HW21_9ARCH|nr:udp-4-keto-6-deoxy-n-acetylglucosamine 4-aminotransferase [uncultured marine thaumarchaeote KM3_87_H02]